MNIAEAERRTGLSRANIRFYEKEGLLTPTRGENGYRDYTEDNVQTLRKIMLLRRLRLSVPDIRAIESGEKALPEAAAGQLDVLQGDIRESEQAYAMCRAICEDRAEWNGLDVDRYQSIVLPADDPREKDRIPPAGCPWRRFFARNVDAGLYGLLWSMLAQWVFRINPENFIQLTASLAWTLACGYAGWLLTFVFEPVLLHYWGTTPGKWIFGLSVRDEDGNKLSIRTAYARLWGVFGYGNCYALPFFDWYYNYKCYRACKEEELSWDLENGCSIVVREREVRWYRVALYLLVIGLRTAAGYGIDLYAKLPPNRGELTLAEYVENCNDCLKYNQGLAPYVRPDGSWNSDVGMGGSYTGFSLGDSVSDVTVETDADGYVQSVTVVSDSQNGSCGYQERMTVYYAFAAAYAKWSWLYADHMRDDIIDDGWEYDVPDTKNVKEAHLDGLDFRYEYEYSNTDTVNVYLNQPMPYHSVLTIEKE